MTTKILLGRLNNGLGTPADGEDVYLSKHQWDCGWYWGFGYLGNNRCYFHFDSLFVINRRNPLASELFFSTHISDKEWWVIRDLFKQAYALVAAAEVYRFGGRQTSLPGVTDILKNSEMAATINADLQKVLDLVWDYCCKAVQPKETKNG